MPFKWSLQYFCLYSRWDGVLIFKLRNKPTVDILENFNRDMWRNNWAGFAILDFKNNLNFSGIPMFASNPHFYQGDSKLFTHIDGLNPEGNDYKTRMNLQPRIGFMMTGRSTIQVNLQVQPVYPIHQLDFFPDGIILPLAWFDVVSILENITIPPKASTTRLTLLISLCLFKFIAFSFYIHQFLHFFFRLEFPFSLSFSTFSLSFIFFVILSVFWEKYWISYGTYTCERMFLLLYSMLISTWNLLCLMTMSISLFNKDAPYVESRISKSYAPWLTPTVDSDNISSKML